MEWSIGSGGSLVRVFPSNSARWRRWDVHTSTDHVGHAWTFAGAVRMARRRHAKIVAGNWSRFDPEWIRN